MSTFDWGLYIGNPKVDALQIKDLIGEKYQDDLGNSRTWVYKHDQRTGYRYVPVGAPCTLDVYDGLRVKQITSGYPDWFGFEPNLSVFGSLTEDLTGPNFTHATREESEAAGLLFVAKVMFQVLANVEGDAVIQAEDYFILLRKNGKVIVDPSRGRWSPELLALLGVDYETREISIPAD